MVRWGFCLLKEYTRCLRPDGWMERVTFGYPMSMGRFLELPERLDLSRGSGRNLLERFRML
jgi:hypothetical protein